MAANKIFNMFKGKKETDNKSLIKNKSLDLVQNAAGDATLYIYDDIGFWGVEARDVANALESLNGQPLTVRVSSNGGSVSEGLAIYSMLKDYAGTVTTINDSVAASIATVIFMAGDERKASNYASFMTHKPMAPFYGNSDELDAHKELLEHFNEVIINAYVSGGIEREQAEAIISDGDNWFMVDEAIELGFATEEIDAPAVSAKVDLSQFDKIPKGVLNSLENLRNVEKPVNVHSTKDEITKPTNEGRTVDFTQAEHDAALVVAQTEARNAALVEASERRTTVLALDSYTGRETLAEALLANVGMTTEAIDNALKASPLAKPGLTVENLTDDAGNIIDPAGDEELEVDNVATFAANIGKTAK